MDKLKNELEETVGLLLAFPEKAVAYGIRWNGILLHGPPGTGKSFIAQATAGEFGLNYISVGAGELLSAFRGRSAQRVVEAFEAARKNLPCLLFFDEFDSVAAKRTSQPSAEERNTVNQLLRSLEKYREFPDLIVMAATNDIDHLDTAAVRPGRFDRKIRVDLPDGKAREAVLSVLLAKRPTRDVNVAGLASTLEGLSVAAIRQVVEAAALKAMQTEASGGDGAITGELLITTAKSGGGHDKPLAQDWNWDDLVLQEETKDELFQVQRFVENADLALEYGVEPPTGILLYGPPGTGKTTIAKVLAAQAHASFYAISPADLISKWVGETEENIAQVFSRARENRPSIVFIDEIDALFPKRGATRSFDDRWTNQLLQEIDGIKSQRGVFVVGATNRRDMLDDALLRGGRLSRQIAIPPPDRECRRKLLELASARMPLVGVNLDKLADEAEGFSGADLKALAQDAAVKAAMRSTKDSSRVKAITSSDFDAALADFKEQKERV